MGVLRGGMLEGELIHAQSGGVYAHRDLEELQLGIPDAIRTLIKRQFKTLQIEIMCSYLIMFVMCIVLIGYLRRNRTEAMRGDSAAARKVILPAYEPLLLIVAITSGLYSVFFTIVLSIGLYEEYIDLFLAELFIAGRNFIGMLVIVFMFQKSISIPALRRTFMLTFGLVFFVIPVYWYLSRRNHDTNIQLVFSYISRGCYVAFYSYVFVYPPPRATRSVLRQYAAFSVIYFGMVFIYMYFLSKDMLATAMKIVLLAALWASLYPVFIWRVLKADTEHWRGMGIRAVGLQVVPRHRRKMNENISSEGLHLLIELHRKYIIDFTNLKLLRNIRNGATSTVMEGSWNSKKCAVKVYTPIEITEVEVSAFSNEAALCATLQHPNIVTFHGMCVCPPTICLVFELCDASLKDVLAINEKRDPVYHRMVINLAYMIDAARALSYLHSFTPPFIHRDIKPSNFLVDGNSVVKLADFGESRSLPMPLSMGNLPFGMPRFADSSLDRQDENGSSRLTIKARSISKCVSRMTVRGTVDYMAPEVMKCEAGKATYGEAADVYSLAITFWEILNPGRDKYPSQESHLKVYDWVIEGKRPPLDTPMPYQLMALIESSWNPYISLRPSARDVVNILESIQQECINELLSTSMDAYQIHSVKSYKGKDFRDVVVGAEMIESFLEYSHACTVNEGTRLGNAFLDCGLLHHVKHDRAFEGNENLYFFDTQKIIRKSTLDDFDQPWRGSNRSRTNSSSQSLFPCSSNQSSVLNSQLRKQVKRPCYCKHCAQGFSLPQKMRYRLPNRKNTARNNESREVSMDSNFLDSRTECETGDFFVYSSMDSSAVQ